MAYDVNKLTKLSQLKLLAERIKEDFATKTTVANLETRINEIVATGGEPNTINKIKVNGVEQTIAADKSVDVKVPTKVSEVTNDSKYQTDTEVATAIQAAIAATGHAVFTKVDAVPSAETAQANVLYLVMNATTNHYDIYAKVGDEVVLVDDTTVDLTAYSTTDQMNAAISAAITGLNIGQYATVVNLTAATDRIKALEDVGAVKVEKSNTNGNILINGVEVVVYTEPSDVVHGAIASDSEVTEMINEVFTVPAA